MKRSLPWTLLSTLALASCAGKGKVAPETPPNPISLAGAPLIRSSTSNTDPGTPIIAGGNAPTSAAVTSALTPESDIVYTNPDDPDAPIPELSDVLTAPSRGPWEQSESIARRRSSREGKPLLIWFTDSQSSPMCKALSQELFSTKEFGEWAMDKLVRLKVDANVVADDPDINLDQKETRLIAIKNYNVELRKRYKVLGYPSLIMLNPSGEVVGRYRGYKRGGADFLWGQMKHAEAVSSSADKSWRASLAKKGYREWEDRKGRKVFARLVSYSAGTLTFIEPDGTRSRTSEGKLSDDDQSWIAQQKKLRNLH